MDSAADVGKHFDISSSFGWKGRILSEIVRFMRPSNCLEFGTAYGMSSLFILGASKEAHLTTVEAMEPQFSIASQILQERYGDRVRCEFGLTDNVLPHVLPSMGGVDFLFHDAGHSFENYTSDFAAVLPHFRPGAVLLLDDIRWSDSRFYDGDPRCYEGWMEIVHHPRVRRAVEIDRTLGLALLG
jgi:predicted O-methyltransferase YrrM